MVEFARACFVIKFDQTQHESRRLIVSGLTFGQTSEGCYISTFDDVSGTRTQHEFDGFRTEPKNDQHFIETLVRFVLLFCTGVSLCVSAQVLIPR